MRDEKRAPILITPHFLQRSVLFLPADLPKGRGDNLGLHSPEVTGLPPAAWELCGSVSQPPK